MGDEREYKSIAYIKNRLQEVNPVVYILLFLIFGWFYWYQWRPTEIRKECNKIATDAAVYQHTSQPGEQEEGSYLQKDYEFYYSKCLRSKGLE